LEKKVNKAIFITVRSGSTRLSQKCFLKINGVMNIARLIARLNKSKKKDVIVLCTTTLPEDDLLCTIAKNNKIFCYRGSIEDKLNRWYCACKKYNVEFFVTADGDDLLCEPELIDLAFKQYENNLSIDFIEGKNLICGSFTYGIKTTALKKVCEIKGTTDTEMIWPYFKDTNLFNIKELKGVPKIFKRPEIRMTLDYEEDLIFFKVIIESLEKEKKNFNLRDVINFLDKYPEVIKINQFLQEKFLVNQKVKTKLILK
jgi:spore coat polysaccharide biosynthesis protein SpsF